MRDWEKERQITRTIHGFTPHSMATPTGNATYGVGQREHGGLLSQSIHIALAISRHIFRFGG